MLTPPILTALTFRELVTTSGLWICLSVVADSVSGESSLPSSDSCPPCWSFRRSVGPSGGSRPDLLGSVCGADTSYFIESSLESLCMKNYHLQFPEVETQSVVDAINHAGDR